MVLVGRGRLGGGGTHPYVYLPFVHAFMGVHAWNPGPCPSELLTGEREAILRHEAGVRGPAGVLDLYSEGAFVRLHIGCLQYVSDLQVSTSVAPGRGCNPCGEMGAGEHTWTVSSGGLHSLTSALLYAVTSSPG